MNISTTISGFLTAYQFESKTVSTSAVGLTQSLFQPRGSEAARDMGNARAAMIQVEGKVRYRLDGADPTGSVGHLLNDGDIITLSSFQQMKAFRVIREIGEVADSTLRVTYLR